ncbi:uncharacterized protein LOC143860050 [Tasmannia lanceolata]|uniref:uncharacterized protein LOC143858660 n=1 Tax=Tasmannia lanceolata TaxID=3420 RepID=UPI004063FA93
MEPRNISVDVEGSKRLQSDERHPESLASQILEDIKIAQAGDSGDGFWFQDDAISNATLPISSDRLSIDAILDSRDKTHSSQSSKDNHKRIPRSLECVSRYTHLAVFGIMGVFARYLLQKLFGPSFVGNTSDRNFLYLDLPSNMVGSFLMGWLGIVFKADINHVSDLLAVGLTVGFLGSLTTFSGWNQKMLDLSTKGHWVFSMLGLLIGMFFAYISIWLGVWTATRFRRLLDRRGMLSSSTWTMDSCRRQMWALVVLVLMLCLMWGISVVLVWTKLESDHMSAELWLACLVAPSGVWLRWVLARLNGRGLGREGLMKWVPFGTLVANVFAACLMAALATIKKVVDTKRCDIVVTGIQLGFLGCLSTVSTFVAEVHAMWQRKHSWRACVYSMVTIIPSFTLGTLIYSVPMWTKDYQ